MWVVSIGKSCAYPRLCCPKIVSGVFSRGFRASMLAGSRWTTHSVLDQLMQTSRAPRNALLAPQRHLLVRAEPRAHEDLLTVHPGNLQARISWAFDLPTVHPGRSRLTSIQCSHYSNYLTRISLCQSYPSWRYSPATSNLKVSKNKIWMRS